MLLPHDEQPVPKKPEPAPKPERAKAAKAASTPRSKKASKPQPSRLPRHVDDARPDLTGSYDLSYEVPEENVPFHVSGADHDWLPISTLPAQLRPSGWVYLQVDNHVVARARVRGIGFRERRWSHQPIDTASDAGDGPTLELHPGSWEHLRESLGADGDRPIPGYRYLHTGSDGSVRIADPDGDPAP